MKYVLRVLFLITFALFMFSLGFVYGSRNGYKLALADVNGNRSIMYVLKKNKYGESVWVSNDNYTYYYDGDQ